MLIAKPADEKISDNASPFAVAGSRAWNSLAYRQPSAQPPNRFLLSKKNLNRFILDSHFGRDNVNTDYVKRSSKSLHRIIAQNKLS